MPLGGVDTRYDASWEEQDKIRRRLALKDHLKLEGITKRFSPYLALKGDIYQDPAVTRYMDLRKRGRLPNTPLHPKLFYGMILVYSIPVIALSWLAESYRAPRLKAMETGETPYSERRMKGFG